MTARAYNELAFIEDIANKTHTPVMMIQTDGMSAHRTRYDDIVGVPEQVRDDLYNGDIAFVSFDNLREAGDAFETLMVNWPEEGETTLGLTMYLGVPGERARIFEAVPGKERSFRLAA